MAKLIEQSIVINLSKVVKDSDDTALVINDTQLVSLLESIPELIESMLSDPTVIVELAYLRE